MNIRQKELIQLQLDNEKEVLERLKQIYREAVDDIDINIAVLFGRSRDGNLQSVIYQVDYQKAIRKQISAILDKLNTEQFSTISEYLTECYENGFVGTLYDLQGQGIPLIIPIDQEEVVKAILHDTKLSKPLYDSLGEDVTYLKKQIQNTLSRGIAQGSSYADIAKKLTLEMVGDYSKMRGGALSKAYTIARTEGHRIQSEAAFNAQVKAKENGAEVFKQWDAALDKRTRPRHAQLDGQLREVDDPFEVAGRKAMFPGGFGVAAEDINCRCALLQRAKWELDEDELQTLKKRAEYFGLDKTSDFEDFKSKYLKANEAPIVKAKVFTPANTLEEAETFAKQLGVKYVNYSKLPLETANELNKAISTLLDDVRPIFVGDSVTLEKYWGGKLPRSSKNYYGVTIQTDGVHLGYGNGFDFDSSGYMVGVSSSYKTSAKITAAKAKSQSIYQEKHGKKWFFNEDGVATPYHEMGHVYSNIKGLPDGFEKDAARWANESGCDMLKKTSEAWSEAWAAYHTGNSDLPDYVAKYIEQVSFGSKNVISSITGLTSFDEDAILTAKINEFSKELSDGKIKTIISGQKQSRHILGSKEFTAYTENLSKRGDFPSYIREDLSISDLSDIIDSKLGTGIIEMKSDNSFQEFFSCDEIIGYYYDKIEGKYLSTKRVQVKYSIGDGNIHVIPVKEK